MRHNKLPLTKALLLFTNFMLVILAYYLIKPASRSLFFDHFSSEQLPYVWIASVLVLAALLPLYSRLVNRVSRPKIVIGSCIFFALCLVGFRLQYSGAVSAVAFYILVDILSVVLVEQFWSLTNASFASREGRSWYGLIGAGGLAGGLLGGLLTNTLLTHFGLSTLDLLWVAAGFLLLIALLSVWLRAGGYVPEKATGTQLTHKAQQPTLSLGEILRHPYLRLITATLLIAQLIQPIIEYQFMSFVESTYTERDARTAYLGNFFAALGAVALIINLILTPLVHRFLGAIAGLCVQPLAVLVSSLWFASNAHLMSAAIMKICDRGLSYSINRASKELLYVPIDANLLYQAKAWIDMFGYRAFKIFSALAILALTSWTGLITEAGPFSYIVLPITLLWLWCIRRLNQSYRALMAEENEALALTEKSVNRKT